ncbi:MAG: HD domain-containing protein [Lachnospiraceae bacterium]|nr:HD domain-containing protein [Lachnospiraceae bacterium]
MFSKTFAAIDVGSFELSLKIYEVSKKNGMRQIDHVRHNIDMGTEIYSNGILSFERVEDLCKTLKEFKKIMNSYKVEAYQAYGTSAIREAKNMDILLDQIEQKSGVHIDVLSNSEQRFLDYKSIAFQGEKFEKFIGQGTAILDIGGGSIQMSLFDEHSLISTQNMKLGVLRLRDNMKTLNASLRQYDHFVEELAESQLTTYKKFYLMNKSIENLIVVDDYFSSILNNKNSSGYSETSTAKYADIDEYIELISSDSQEAVAKFFSISEDDIALLYISLLLIQKVMSTTGAKTAWAPGVTLCDGIAYEYAEKGELVKANHNFEDDIVACSKEISKRYMGSNERSETLEQIALNIFDTMSGISGLEKRDRMLLRISAILHDCGKYVSMLNLADCSYNIIKNTEIIGLSHKERLIVANTVKYNQTVFNYYDEQNTTEGLDRMDYKRIAKLTAMLRLANGLDRSHKMKFKDVHTAIEGGKLMITIETDEDISLEKGLFGRRANFFEEVYNLKPVIHQKRGF